MPDIECCFDSAGLRHLDIQEADVGIRHGCHSGSVHSVTVGADYLERELQLGNKFFSRRTVVVSDE